MSKPTRSRSQTSKTSRSTRATRSTVPPTSPESVDPDTDLDAFEIDLLDSFAARGRATKKKAKHATIAAGAPWVKRGIDYGPARAAFKDLATWALDLAEREVADVAADRRHVRSVRRAVLGVSDREPSATDVMVTAEVLARVLDRDLGLDLSDQLAIFDQLELSSDFLPMWLPAPRASTPLDGRTPLRSPAPAKNERPTPTVRLRIELGATAPSTARTPLPLRFCEDCGYVHEPDDHVRHGYRNAA